MENKFKDYLDFDEEIHAMVSGRIEVASMGGAVCYPSDGFLVATNKRILYFEKVGNKLEESETKEIPYDSVSKVMQYRDFFNGTTGLCKTFSLQNKEGDLYRFVAPDGSDEFISFVNNKCNLK